MTRDESQMAKGALFSAVALFAWLWWKARAAASCGCAEPKRLAPQRGQALKAARGRQSCFGGADEPQGTFGGGFRR